MSSNEDEFSLGKSAGGIIIALLLIPVVKLNTTLAWVFWVIGALVFLVYAIASGGKLGTPDETRSFATGSGGGAKHFMNKIMKKIKKW